MFAATASATNSSSSGSGSGSGSGSTKKNGAIAATIAKTNALAVVTAAAMLGAMALTL